MNMGKKTETAQKGRRVLEEAEKALDSKQRIFNAAVRLFAKKGFNGTGMRELAAEADVKLAAINYFYGSKIELLEAVLDEYFRRYQEMAEQALSKEDSPESGLRRFIQSAIAFFREHPDLIRIVFTELPYNIPEITQFKADRVNKLKQLFRREHLMHFAKLNGEPLLLEIVGPALTGMIAFHFLQRPVIEELSDISFDEAFYERYSEVITDLFLHGILGLGISNPSNSKRENDGKD
jgi:AcrR family transcriptional regulator